MQNIFEELDYQNTSLGEISLRRRTEPRLDNKLIYEVKLGDEFLMSSLFVEAEEQLSKLALARLKGQSNDIKLDVVIGGLGLGYTALTSLQDDAVGRLRVIEVMKPVIKWHQQGLLPIGDVLAVSERCELIHGDFFSIATTLRDGFINNDKVDAILLDIDHSPSHWLKQTNSSFYSYSSLQAMANKIKPKGVFGLWSNELPDHNFVELLNAVFCNTQSFIVRFANPYSGGEAINSVYIASKRTE